MSNDEQRGGLMDLSNKPTKRKRGGLIPYKKRTASTREEDEKASPSVVRKPSPAKPSAFVFTPPKPVNSKSPFASPFSNSSPPNDTNGQEMASDDTNPSVGMVPNSSTPPSFSFGNSAPGNGYDFQDSEDESPVARPKKRAMFSDKPLPIDDDDEDLDGDNSNAMMSGSDDDSFFDLIGALANLDLPDTSPSTKEACPLCPLSFPLSEFANHVLECIKQLDEVEKEHQLQLDAKMAEKLSREANWGMSSGGPLPDYKKPTSCPDGVNCRRTDANHFILIKHPDVSCCVCGQMFPPFEINAHINFCLTSGHSTISRPVFSNDSSGLLRDSKNDMIDSDDESDTGGPSSPPVLSSQSSTSFSSFSSSSPSSPSSSSNPSSRRNSIGLAGQPNRSSSGGSLQRSSSSSASSSSSSSSGSLSSRVMQAMARKLVAEQKNSSPGLYDMLNGFQRLGFTRDALKRQLSQGRLGLSNDQNPANNDNNDPMGGNDDEMPLPGPNPENENDSRMQDG